MMHKENVLCMYAKTTYLLKSCTLIYENV